MILTSAGFTHLFADKPGSYACVEASEIIVANPDVLVIIEASWDSALNKIDHMHNSSAWCGAPFVKAVLQTLNTAMSDSEKGQVVLELPSELDQLLIEN